MPAEADNAEREAKIKALAEFLDAVLPFDALLPGIIGQVVEKNDDKALQTLIHHLSKVCHGDPVKKAARAERRKRRREEREQRKARKGKSDVE